MKMKIPYVGQAVKIFALRQHFIRMTLKDEARVVAVRVFAYKLRAPLKGAHDSVFIALRKMALARANQASNQNSSLPSPILRLRRPTWKLSSYGLTPREIKSGSRDFHSPKGQAANSLTACG